MKKPVKLKVGGITYDIVYREMDNECGKADFDNSTITINSKQNQDQIMVSLIHEVLHCLNNQLEETTVEFLAQGMYQILKDNFD